MLDISLTWDVASEEDCASLLSLDMCFAFFFLPGLGMSVALRLMFRIVTLALDARDLIDFELDFMDVPLFFFCAMMGWVCYGVYPPFGSANIFSYSLGRLNSLVRLFTIRSKAGCVGYTVSTQNILVVTSLKSQVSMELLT